MNKKPTLKKVLSRHDTSETSHSPSNSLGSCSAYDPNYYIVPFDPFLFWGPTHPWSNLAIEDLTIDHVVIPQKARRSLLSWKLASRQSINSSTAGSSAAAPAPRHTNSQYALTTNSSRATDLEHSGMDNVAPSLIRSLAGEHDSHASTVHDTIGRLDVLFHFLKNIVEDQTTSAKPFTSRLSLLATLNRVASFYDPSRFPDLASNTLSVNVKDWITPLDQWREALSKGLLNDLKSHLRVVQLELQQCLTVIDYARKNALPSIANLSTFTASTRISPSARLNGGPTDWNSPQLNNRGPQRAFLSRSSTLPTNALDSSASLGLSLVASAPLTVDISSFILAFRKTYEHNLGNLGRIKVPFIHSVIGDFWLTLTHQPDLLFASELNSAFTTIFSLLSSVRSEMKLLTSFQKYHKDLIHAIFHPIPLEIFHPDRLALVAWAEKYRSPLFQILESTKRPKFPLQIPAPPPDSIVFNSNPSSSYHSSSTPSHATIYITSEASDSTSHIDMSTSEYITIANMAEYQSLHKVYRQALNDPLLYSKSCPSSWPTNIPNLSTSDGYPFLKISSESEYKQLMSVYAVYVENFKSFEIQWRVDRAVLDQWSSLIENALKWDSKGNSRHDKEGKVAASTEQSAQFTSTPRRSTGSLGSASNPFPQQNSPSHTSSSHSVPTSNTSTTNLPARRISTWKSGSLTKGNRGEASILEGSPQRSARWVPGLPLDVLLDGSPQPHQLDANSTHPKYHRFGETSYMYNDAPSEDGFDDLTESYRRVGDAGSDSD